MTPKILLTGIHGQVGFELQGALAVLGEVIALDRAALDLSNTAQLIATLNQFQPTIIVNPAAYTAVDKAEAEPALAAAINATAPALMAQWAAQHGALLVHYSTDYVFDGNQSTAYVETDSTNPQSVYGATKLAGEQAITVSGAAHLIFRTSWVYGVHGANFIKTILRLAAERTELRVVADQVGVPTSARYITAVTVRALQHYLRSNQAEQHALHGIYHLTPAGETNWHAYAKCIVHLAIAQGKALQCTPENIHAIGTVDYPTPARRPISSRLSGAKVQQAFRLDIPNWEADVQATVAEILTHDAPPHSAR